MPETERWKQDFPITTGDDSYTTRRELMKFLGLTSLAFLVGTCAAAARKLWKRSPGEQIAGAAVAHVEEIPVGGYKLFRYPTENDPCILVRLDAAKFVAFDQRCTHLACPVYLDSASNQLACPCHKAFFSAEDGRILAGPPKRPLEGLRVSIRRKQIWVERAEDDI